MLAHRPLEPPGDVDLGAADDRLVREGLVDGIDDRGRAADRLELALVLDAAERLDEPLGRNELGSA